MASTSFSYLDSPRLRDAGKASEPMGRVLEVIMKEFPMKGFTLSIDGENTLELIINIPLEPQI